MTLSCSDCGLNNSPLLNPISQYTNGAETKFLHDLCATFPDRGFQPLIETPTKTMSQPDSRIKCTYGDCDKSFSSAASLNRHVNPEHLGMRYVCPVDENQQKQPAEFLRHMKKHPEITVSNSSDFLQKVI